MICQGLSREKANELYRKVLKDNDTEAMRRLCLEDLFFLLTIACKRKDIDRDWLYDRSREVEASPNGHLDLWAREHYKLFMLDEPIPTPAGWKNHGDLIPGDDVFSPDGKPIKVLARTEVFESPPLQKITFDDGFEIIAGDDHLWEVERRTRKRIKSAYNKPGPKRMYRESVILSTSEIAQHMHQADNRLAVRVNAPLDLPDADLPIHPYLLGVWLGDGTSAEGRITCGDDCVFKAIEGLGYTLSKDYTPNRNSQNRNIGGLKERLKALGLINNKHIPDIYLRSSAQQRLELLQGLMDTDGHCNTRGTATFVNINEQLISGFVELCHTLGLKPRKRAHHSKVKSEPYLFWQVSFQAYKDFPVFKMQRKLDRCKDGKRQNPRRFIVSCERVDTAPGSCIQVEGGLYLAGKNFVTTHNSTIITFGKSIQDVLKDPDNTTIGIFSHTRPIAKGFVEQIKRELENNSFLKDLFPEVLYQNPRSESPRWSLDSGLVVKRNTNPKEATIEAWGVVDGQPTGKHFTILVYDDVVTRGSVTTPEMIKKVTESWELSLNLGAHGGRARYIGTRYHFNDTYKTMMDRGSVSPRVYPATDNGKMDGSPVFLDKETLMTKRRDMGPYTFGTQMLQNPVADKAMGFKEEWLMYYQSLSDFRSWNTYVVVDPAGEKKKGSDYTVIAAIGLAPDQNYYLLDAVRDRMNLTERTSKLFEFHRKYNPIDTGYEKYGMQSDIEHIQYVQEKENYRFNITALGGPMPKNDRIKRLIPVFEQKRFYLPQAITFKDYEGKTVDFVHDFVNEEYLAFPVCIHDDMLDCIARILEQKLDAKFPKKREIQKETNPGPILNPGQSWMG